MLAPTYTRFNLTSHATCCVGLTGRWDLNRAQALRPYNVAEPHQLHDIGRSSRDNPSEYLF